MIKVLKKYFSKGEKASDSITKSAFLIAIMGLASRFLGLFRDRLLADKFGAGDLSDAYYAAFKIPDLVYGLLVLGALSAAFLPVFTGLLSKKKTKEAWVLVNIMLSTGFLVLVIVTGILFIFAPILVSGLTFGFSLEKQILVTKLTRIMLLSPILLGISGIFGGILNSFKKFFFYSLAPIFYNIGIIIGILFFVEGFGPIGLALGVVLGATFHMLIQLPEVFRCGFSFQFVLNSQNRHFKKIIKLMIPRVMGVAVSQVNFLIVTVLASTLLSGSLAIFTFANNLQSVPLGLFGVSFAVAAFPVLSSLWAQKKERQFGEKLLAVFQKILFFIIPCSAVLYVLRAQIVRVVLGTGEFDWPATVVTLETLGLFTFSLWSQGSIPLLARAFYAINNTKVPFLTALFSEMINVFLAVFLIQEYGVLGLAAAFSIASILNAILLGLILRWKVKGFRLRKGFIQETTKVLIATFLMMATIQLLKNLITDDPFGEELTFLGVFTQMIVALIGGGGVFILVGWLLKLKNLNEFMAVLKSKIFKSKTISVEGRDEVGGVVG